MYNFCNFVPTYNHFLLIIFYGYREPNNQKKSAKPKNSTRSTKKKITVTYCKKEAPGQKRYVTLLKYCFVVVVFH